MYKTALFGALLTIHTTYPMDSRNVLLGAIIENHKDNSAETSDALSVKKATLSLISQLKKIVDRCDSLEDGTTMELLKPLQPCLSLTDDLNEVAHEKTYTMQELQTKCLLLQLQLSTAQHNLKDEKEKFSALQSFSSENYQKMVNLERQVNSTFYHSPQKRMRELDLSEPKATPTSINGFSIS